MREISSTFSLSARISTMCVYCRLKVAQDELAKVMAQLKEKQEKLASIEAKVSSNYVCTCFIRINCILSLLYISIHIMPSYLHLDCRLAGKL